MAEIIWDSELGPSWPDDWEHTTVHAQFVAVTGDGADTDRLPDIAPSGNGEVIFTPSLRTVRYVGADGPYVVSLKQYRAVVDNEGYLCTPDQYGQPGERGIVLPSTDAEVIEPRGEDDNAFTWRVDFDIPAVTIRSDHISVPVDGPYNLVDLLSPERAAGVVHIIDRVSARDAIQAAQEATAARDLVLPARDQTLAARDETLQHGITVDTSVGTRVFVGDTMIHGDTGWRDVTDLAQAALDPSNTGTVSVTRRTHTTIVRFNAVILQQGEGSLDVLDLPSGFRPIVSREVIWGGTRNNNTGHAQAFVIANSTLVWTAYFNLWTGSSGRDRPSSTFTGTITFPSDSWPTSLPGTPA